MDWITEQTGTLWLWLRAFLPALFTLAIFAVALPVANRLLLGKRIHTSRDRRFGAQLVMLAITGVAIVILVLALPIETATRGQLLSLLGLVFTAVIALSSTAFVSNAMAGLMLRALNNFKLGDFVRVADQFGRVTHRGLFHTEIQTEDRDLATIPNLFLVTQPVAVVRESGTVVSALVSLGYDVSHQQVEPLLLEAASNAGLDDPFVQVLDLGDFSVSYRVAGFLEDVKHLITARSNLRRAMMDCLHGAGVEIVSPTVMNQRPLGRDELLVPSSTPAVGSAPLTHGDSPESRVFDKADRAERMGALQGEIEELEAQAAQLAKEKPSDEAEERRHAQQTNDVERRLHAVQHQLTSLSEAEED